jgi:hypothetical protein
LAGVLHADRARSDVNTALGISGDHGYDGVVEVHAVTVAADLYGIDSGGGENALIGQRSTIIPLTATVPPPPPPVDPPPDPQPEPPVEPDHPHGPVLTVDDVTAIARTVARDEIIRTHLQPGA